MDHIEVKRTEVICAVHKFIKPFLLFLTASWSRAFFAAFSHIQQVISQRLGYLLLTVRLGWFLLPNVAIVFVYNLCERCCHVFSPWTVIQMCWSSGICFEKKKNFTLLISTYCINSWINNYAFMIQIFEMLHSLSFIWCITITCRQCNTRGNQIWDTLGGFIFCNIDFSPNVLVTWVYLLAMWLV